MRYALINKDNVIVNIIEVADLKEYKGPRGHTLQEIKEGDLANKGGKFIAGVWSPREHITSVDQLKEERQQRLSKGFDYDFQDARGIHNIGTTEADMVGWNVVDQLASAQLHLGNTTFTINIMTNTGPAQVTTLEWKEIMVAAGTFQQPIWAAYFTLKAQNPIPVNYSDDSHWP